MARVPLPRYTRAITTTGGPAYYWELPGWARPPASRFGKQCPIVSTPLGSDLSVAITKGEALNEALDQWRRGERSMGLAPGSVASLFAWYRTQRKFLKNRAKTQSDYRKLMDAVETLPMKVGVFGDRTAKVGPEVADTLYEKFQMRGARQAVYMVQVCRAVWNLAGRYSNVTGIPKGQNTFSGMGNSYTPAKGNRAASRAEYDLYRTTARKLGFQSMATAAALSFELVQRVSDAFGITDADEEGVGRQSGRRRGIAWEDYVPGVRMRVIQSKTGKRLRIPLVDIESDGERLSLYPELEAELALSWTPGSSGLIVVEDRNGQPYGERRMSTVHRRICNAAGLPKEMTFTGFRHGGATEIGDAGEADIRPLSGHSELNVAAIYDKITEEKARRIGRQRRAHIARITGSTDEDGTGEA